jgi:NTE family protein
MLDEVDIITSVSGGSFTALAYALDGERLFSDYESRFLKRDVEGALIARAFNPFDWPKLLSSGYGRSELAAAYYDEILFEGATFGDLVGKPTPVAVPSATDLSTGDRFPFMEDNFNLICSDLTKVRLSRTAAASSAVPVVLSPVTFNNYGGHCCFEFPLWIRDALANRDPDFDTRRALQRYQELVELQDSAARPYLHLVDGGVSDNVAMRPIVELLETVDVSRRREMFPLLRDVRRIAVIVVNAASSPAVDWGRIETAPGIFDQLWQASSVPIDRYSYESIDLLKDIVSRWRLERRLAIAEARLAGKRELDEELRRPTIDLYAIDVSFRDIADPQERRYFENLPTSFVLSPDAVDKLRDIAGRVLRASPAYRRLIQGIEGASGKDNAAAE